MGNTIKDKIRKDLFAIWNDIDFMTPYMELRYDKEMFDEDEDEYAREFDKLCEYITEEQLDNLMEGILQEANDRIRAFVEDRIVEMEADND